MNKKVYFHEEKMSNFSNSPHSDSFLISLVIKLSGEHIKNKQQALVLLFIFFVILTFIAIFIQFTGNSEVPVPPTSTI